MSNPNVPTSSVPGAHGAERAGLGALTLTDGREHGEHPRRRRKPIQSSSAAVSRSESTVRRAGSAGHPLTRRTSSGGGTMSSTVLYMSMSLDGFVAGPNVSVDNGLGDGGERLHEWLFPGAEDGREPPDLRRVHVHPGHRRRARDLRACGRLGRRPSRRCAHLHPQPSAGTRLGGGLARRALRQRPRRRHARCQARCRRQERAGPRREHRAARPHRRAPRRARDPPDPGPPRRWATAVRAPRRRTARAGAGQRFSKERAASRTFVSGSAADDAGDGRDGPPTTHGFPSAWRAYEASA